MKKLLYLAMAAIVLMACNQGEKPDLVKKDNKMLDKAAKGAIGLLGQSQETVDAKILKLGFTKVDSEKSLPMRRALMNKMPRAKAEVERDTLVYVYNAPEGVQRVSELDSAEAVDFRNKIVESKKIYVELSTIFEDDECIAAIGNLTAGLDAERIEYLPVNFNQTLYNQVMNVDGKGDADGAWASIICNTQEMGLGALLFMFAAMAAPEPSTFTEGVGDDVKGLILKSEDFNEWKEELLVQKADTFTLMTATLGAASRKLDEKHSIDYRYSTMWLREAETIAAEDRDKGLAPTIAGIFTLIDADAGIFE